MPRALTRKTTAFIALLAVACAVAGAAAASARSTRSSSGFTGRQTHATWGGPGVGLTAWGVATDFVGNTACGSSWVALDVASAWNSSALHNGAVLGMFFSVTRTDGQHIKVGPVYRITKARAWPGHPAFDGQFRASVYTPRGMYLKSATVTTFLLNGNVAYPPAFNDTVPLKQYTKSC